MKTNSVAIKGKDSCCGCGNCAISCPKNAVRMDLDGEGFEYPTVDEDLCVNCGKCIKVCPFELAKDEPCSNVISCYSGFYNTDKEHLSTSSGGVATAISKSFIKSGGIVYGVAYADDYKSIIVKRVDDVKDLPQLKGSKYAQAYKGDTYLAVKLDLAEGKKVLYIGLPCDVVALKKFIKEDHNLYTAELICSGITSPSMHRQFVEQIEKTTGKKITYFTYRNKDKGWHWPSIQAFSGGTLSYNKLLSASLAGYAFKTFMRYSCYNCQCKVYNKADLTLGDFWGLSKRELRYNSNGVSAIIVHSEKGVSLMSSLDDFILHGATFEEIKKGNPRLYSCLAKPINREKFGNVFAERGLIAACDECRMWKDKIKDLVKELISIINL